MLRSRIEYDEFYEAWAIHCCDCGEYLEAVNEKPTHGAFTCPDGCEEDMWVDGLDEGYEAW